MQNRLRAVWRFLKKKKPTAPPAAEPVDDRPDYQRKIDAINELCEARKAEFRLLQGGRIVTQDNNAPLERTTPTWPTEH